MHTIYRDLALARAHAAVESAKAVKDLEPSALKGQLREILVKELLRPSLPADIGLGNGVIITAGKLDKKPTTRGRTSKQQDVVIYDKQILPPIVLEQTTGIFPIEAVLYTIEVKSRLTRAELQQSHDSAAELLKEFEYQEGEFATPNGQVVRKKPQPLIATVFAFDTDLEQGGKTEVARYDEILAGADPTIAAICVVERGYWYWQPGPHRWSEWRTQKLQNVEVLEFIAGVMNTYPGIIQSRGAQKLGRYLIDEQVWA